MRLRKLLPLITLLSLLGLLLLGLLNRHHIFDWWRLRNYLPASEVVRLADETSMNDSARRLFYAYHPALEDKKSFNDHCRDNERTIVLGCYLDRKGIYLLDIQDDRLKGIEEVTAAHELLHAAYARLSNKERQNIDSLLNANLKLIKDQRILDTVELYRQHRPETVVNELHSILATEVRELTPELEEYYKQYFNDRLKIVALSEQYENEFTNRKNQIKDYDAQLASLKAQIDDLRQELNTAEAELNGEKQRLNNLRNSSQTQAFNAAVPGYNQKVNDYNNNIERLSDLIAEFNDIVLKRNSIASEEQELVKAIDSRAVVPQAQ